MEHHVPEFMCTGEVVFPLTIAQAFVHVLSEFNPFELRESQT